MSDSRAELIKQRVSLVRLPHRVRVRQRHFFYTINKTGVSPYLDLRLPQLDMKES